MTDAKPPGPSQPQVTNSSPQTTELNAEARDKGERVGTILMIVGISAVVVLVLDLALKGKLLAPLFALLPAPRPKTAPEAPDAPPPSPE